MRNTTHTEEKATTIVTTIVKTNTVFNQYNPSCLLPTFILIHLPLLRVYAELP